MDALRGALQTNWVLSEMPWWGGGQPGRWDEVQQLLSEGEREKRRPKGRFTKAAR
jgi:hypothetical protein